MSCGKVANGDLVITTVRLKYFKMRNTHILLRPYGTF
jgi:hypothetical protein